MGRARNASHGSASCEYPWMEGSEAMHVCSVGDNGNGFWQKLVERLHQTLKRSVGCLFAAGESSPVQGQLNGDCLLLDCRTPLSKQLVNTPEVLQTVGENASALLGRKITARITEQEKQRENPNFDRLMGFAKEHPDIVELK